MIAGSAVGHEAQVDRGSSLIIWIARLREAGIIVALLMLMTFVSFSNSIFLTSENIRNILLAIAILATLAIGETMVILAKQIDLSVAANMGVTVMIIAQILKAHPGMSLAIAMLICIAIGIGLGAVNGLLVAVGRVPAIIATLGTLNIYHGIQSIASGGGEVVSGDLPGSYLNLAGTNETPGFDRQADKSSVPIRLRQPPTTCSMAGSDSPPAPPLACLPPAPSCCAPASRNPHAAPPPTRVPRHRCRTSPRLPHTVRCCPGGLQSTTIRVS